MMIVGTSTTHRVPAVLFWIAAVLTVYLAQLFIPSLFRLWQPGVGLFAYVGSRDHLPPLTPIGGRSDRAARNLAESLPFFLSAAILIIVMGRETSLALLGAQVFFWGRLAYLGLYLAAVPWLRSLAWAIAFTGVLVMAWPLVGV